jgi:hypothetical protein
MGRYLAIYDSESTYETADRCYENTVCGEPGQASTIAGLLQSHDISVDVQRFALALLEHGTQPRPYARSDSTMLSRDRPNSHGEV